MKRAILLGMIILLLSLNAFAYVPPPGNKVGLVLQTPYTPPPGNKVELQLIDLIGPCEYDGDGDWEINLADDCDVGNIDLLGNRFIMTGNGTFKGNLTNFASFTINSEDYDVIYVR